MVGAIDCILIGINYRGKSVVEGYIGNMAQQSDLSYVAH
jgi:hypothetical protein